MAKEITDTRNTDPDKQNDEKRPIKWQKRPINGKRDHRHPKHRPRRTKCKDSNLLNDSPVFQNEGRYFNNATEKKVWGVEVRVRDLFNESREVKHFDPHIYKSLYTIHCIYTLHCIGWGTFLMRAERSNTSILGSLSLLICVQNLTASFLSKKTGVTTCVCVTRCTYAT